MKFVISLLFAATLFTQLSCGGKPTSLQPERRQQLSSNQRMKLYNQAMIGFWKNYDLSISKTLKSHRELWNQMGWAEAAPDSSITAISSGRAHGFFVLYHYDSPMLKKWFPTMHTSTTNGYPTIMIRPDFISAQWKPVFLIHEMTHVLLKLEMLDVGIEETELAAYRSEKAALAATTKTDLNKELDIIIDQLNVNSELNFIQVERSRINPLLIQLDRHISRETPHSNSELEMRLGLYFILLGLRFIERGNVPDTVYMRRATEYLKQFLASNRTVKH